MSVYPPLGERVIHDAICYNEFPRRTRCRVVATGHLNQWRGRGTRQATLSSSPDMNEAASPLNAPTWLLRAYLHPLQKKEWG